MTPIKQTKLYSNVGIHNGNCYASCFASLLDLPLWMVPPFDDMFGRKDWYNRPREWLEKMCRKSLKHFVVHDDEEHPLDVLPEFYIATGKSPRGVYHAVIYSKGKLFHDPHPSDAGIISVQGIEYLEDLK